MNEKDFVEFMKNYTGTPGVIGAFGGLAHYIYQVSKGERFRFLFFIANIFLAGWLAHTVASFLPNNSMRDSIIGITGFCSYPLLAIIEKKGSDFISKFILK